MAASYPASVWSPPTITDDDGAGGGTDLTASLLISPAEEIEAIEVELGQEPNGICGSVAERLQVEIDLNGKVRNKVQTLESEVGLTDYTKMRKLQARVEVVTPDSNGFWSITFDETFSSVPAVFAMACGVDVTNSGGGETGALSCTIKGAPTTSGFTGMLFSYSGAIQSNAAGQANKFRVSWIAMTRVAAFPPL